MRRLTIASLLGLLLLGGCHGYHGGYGVSVHGGSHGHDTRFSVYGSSHGGGYGYGYGYGYRHGHGHKSGHGHHGHGYAHHKHGGGYGGHCR